MSDAKDAHGRLVAQLQLAFSGAGLERRNIKEYEDAALYARACGRVDLIDCLLTMAEVEWDHELYFRAKAAGHPLARFVPVWGPPPSRESIRAAFVGVRAAR